MDRNALVNSRSAQVPPPPSPPPPHPREKTRGISSVGKKNIGKCPMAGTKKKVQIHRSIVIKEGKFLESRLIQRYAKASARGFPTRVSFREISRQKCSQDSLKSKLRRFNCPGIH